ncbi:MAG: hypothetical protein JNK78_02465 [Planctomycetes bacterium]|nr:hypothetical protein [Planctomycetota bacterium]
MTLRQFDHGYWYATELRSLAARLGLPGGRKDRVDKAVRAYRRRSGARCRRNRWRERQVESGRRITGRDVVRSSTSPPPCAKVPVGRYIDFLADHPKNERNATHAMARGARHEAKELDAEKSSVGRKHAQRRGPRKRRPG